MIFYKCVRVYVTLGRFQTFNKEVLFEGLLLNSAFSQLLSLVLPKFVANGPSLKTHIISRKSRKLKSVGGVSKRNESMVYERKSLFRVIPRIFSLAVAIRLLSNEIFCRSSEFTSLG
ncbi:hypothetical protein TNIN_41791 [Trichonephila inaurata madagascariensis]|uniref:Uncharacterized protein n=1 Tax=Trichonephila inaurata madagascariensis TaxID=2747483 RepID=A0A8X6M9C3_9ARAC|nr:hypothetical protein TNIN_41791 [Trichonephila inaurata madagascariensis]